MKLPPRLDRKTIKAVLTKLSNETWDYLFDYEKENGLAQCRTAGWNSKVICYDTEQLKTWLMERCYYLPEDFEAKSSRPASPWSALLTT